MSIYSGFATRFQEQAYDHCIDSLLYVLQKRLIKFYQGEQSDEVKFISVVTKLHQQMRNMEKSKYLEPKSSRSIAQLIKFMQNYEQNIVINGRKDHSVASENHQMHSVQAPKPAEQQTSSKKKLSFWVQKESKVEPTNQQQNLQKEEQIHSKDNVKQASPDNKSDDKQSQFKRTNFHNNQIFAVRAKATSKNNLGRAKQQRCFTGIQSKPEQIRPISVLLNEQYPTAYSKATFKDYQQEQGNNRSRKIRSINKSVNQIEHEYFSANNDISDIIKDYIIKTKRSKKVMSRHSKHKMEYLGKINDF